MNPVPASRLVAAVVVCSVSVLASCAGDVFRGAPGAGGTSVGAAGFGGVGSAGGAASAGGAGSTGGASATGHGGATTATSTGGAGGVVTSSGGAGQGGCGGAPAITCHRDADHDGFGDPGVTSPAVCGACPEGFVTDHADCNDDPTIGAAYRPGQTECFAHDPGGGWDFDCDGETHPAVSGCPACAHASPNERWCSADCSLRVWKLDAIFVACGEPGLVPRFAQTCGVGPGCDYGGGQALTNDVGSDADACVQSCR